MQIVYTAFYSFSLESGSHSSSEAHGNLSDMCALEELLSVLHARSQLRSANHDP